jgi:uncharacterized protein
MSRENETFVPVDLPVLLVALAVTFVATVVQGSIGIGLGMLSVPVLTLVDPVLTPVPQLLVTIPLTLAMLKGERQAIEWKPVARVAAARIPGIGLGIWLLGLADQRLLDGMIGLIVLAAVGLIASGITVHRNHTSEVVAGVLSGTTGTISSIGGPPLALLYRRDTGPAVRSNLAAIFFIGILMMVGARAVSGHVAGTDVMVALWLFPMVAAGFLTARRLHGRIEGGPLRVGILAVSTLAALGLLLRALFG